MPSVILDTNVLVSAFISKGAPHSILYDLVLGDKVEVLVSSSIMAEYLITGNTRDFTFEFFENTQIISPNDFLETFSF